MHVSEPLDNILEDLEDLDPLSLTDIVRFVRAHEEYPKIILLLKNSKKASRYFLGLCKRVINDVPLAGLLVIASDTGDDLYNELMSRASQSVTYHWTIGIASGHFLREAHETIHKSA